MGESALKPEIQMVRRALAPGAAAAVLAAGVAHLLDGAGAAASAGLGVALVVANFAAHGWSLARASDVSLTAVHVVALGGLVVRLGVLLGLMFALNALPWFSPVAFGLAVVPAALTLLVYEAWLVLRRGGFGVSLQIPPEPAAALGAKALVAREGRP